VFSEDGGLIDFDNNLYEVIRLRNEYDRNKEIMEQGGSIGGSVSSLQKSLKKKYSELKTLLLSEHNDVISIDMIEVDSDKRKEGVGSAVIQEIVNYADANKKEISLLPALSDDRKGTTSRSRLVKFYKRFGFVENKGRNKDFSKKGGSMYRLPKMAKGGSVSVNQISYDDLSEKAKDIYERTLVSFKKMDAAKKKKGIADIESKLEAHEKGLDTIGFGSSSDFVDAAKYFIQEQKRSKNKRMIKKKESSEKYYRLNNSGSYHETKKHGEFDFNGLKFLIVDSGIGDYSVIEDETGAVIKSGELGEVKERALRTLESHKDELNSSIDNLKSKGLISPRYSSESKMFKDAQKDRINELIKAKDYVRLFGIISNSSNRESRKAYSEVSGVNINGYNQSDLKKHFIVAYSYDFDKIKSR